LAIISGLTGDVSEPPIPVTTGGKISVIEMRALMPLEL